MIRQIASFLAISCFLITPAFARIEGVSYGSLEIDGQNIEFPLGNPEREREYYYLKTGLNGDPVAMEIFLQGEEKREWFIGEYSAKWIRVSKDKIEVL